MTSSFSSFDSSESEESSFISTSTSEVEIESSIDEITSESSFLPSIDLSTLYGGYYESLSDWENGEDLRRKLHDIIHGEGYEPIEYVRNGTANWQSNANADRQFDDLQMLNPVYSAKIISPSLTNVGWNREHAFPASLMCGMGTGEAVGHLGRATDFHNLFAASQSGNSARGNKNFGVADETSTSYKAGEDYCADERNFEPGDTDKGRLSRAIFYMATMYMDDEPNGMKGLSVVEGYVDYLAGDKCAYAIGNKSTLLEWSNAFPVDFQEILHNESVYSFVPELSGHAQGNRNPYVDFPELVDYAFGEKSNEAGSLEGLTSTWEMFGFDGPTDNYAIIEAKREYEIGDTLEKEDVKVARFGANLELEETEDFTFDIHESLQNLDHLGEFDIRLVTPGNSITYTITVSDPDPIESADYHYTFLGKGAGGDLTAIKNSPGMDNLVNLGGIEWNIRYEKGAIGNRDPYLGVAFGTNSAPVQQLVLETSEEVSFQEKTKIANIVFRGSAASGQTYDISFFINEEAILRTKLGYLSQQEPSTIEAKPREASPGKVRIVISKITARVTVKSIGLHLA